MTELRTLGDSGARIRAALITLACLIVGFSLARSSSALGLWALSALLGASAVAIPVGYSVARAQPIALQALERIPVILLGCAMITMTWNGVRFGQLLGLIDVFQLRTGNGQIGQILTLSDAFLLASLLSLVPLIVERRGHPPPIPLWVSWPAIVLVAIGLTGVIALQEPNKALVAMVRLTAAMTIVPMVIAYIGGGIRALPIMVDLWIFSATVSGGVAVSDYLLGTTFGQDVTGVVSGVRVAGLTTQANHLSFVAVFTIPLIIARLASTRRISARLWLAASFGVCGVAILASGSRGGLLVGALVIVITPLLLPRPLWARAARLTLVAVVAAALSIMVLTPQTSFIGIERVLSPGEANAGTFESDQLRAGLRAKAIENFRSNPMLGVGLQESRVAHSVYLQLLASAGIVGLSAFVVFIFGYFRWSRRITRAPHLDLRLRATAAAAGVSALAWALLGVVENQIADRYLFVPAGFVLAAGILAAPSSTQSPEELLDESVDSGEKSRSAPLQCGGQALS